MVNIIGRFVVEHKYASVSVAQLVILVVSVIAYLRARATARRQAAMRRVLEELVQDRDLSAPRIAELLQWYGVPAKSSDYMYLRYLADHAKHDGDGIRRSLPGPKTGPSASYRKKEAITSTGPKTFYYLDETQVRDLHTQLIPVLEPSRIETQESGASEGGLQAQIHVVQGGFKRSGSQATTRTYEPQLTLAAMYNRIEMQLFDAGDVAFGVEDFDYDREYIDEFLSMCEEMKDKFKCSIPKPTQDEFVASRIRAQALEQRDAVSSKTGFVAVQGSFTATTADGDICTLAYDHPLSAHLAEGDVAMRLVIVCLGRYLSESARTAFTLGKDAKIICLCKVVRWDPDAGELVLNPIAVY